MIGLALLLLLTQTTTTAAETVHLDFPEDVELKLVVDYVATTLNLNVIYDETQVNKRVALRVSEPIPKDSLLGLLHTLLRSRGLALVEADQPDWLKIIPAEQAQAESGGLHTNLAELETAPGIITYILRVRHADLERMKTALTPYLSKPGGAAQTVPESRLLLITDYARNIERITELAELIDVAAAGVVIQTITVQHQNAGDLAALVSRLLAEQGRFTATGQTPNVLSLQPDPLSGDLIAVGLPQQIEQAAEMVRRFDVPTELETHLYQPRFITASRLRTLTEQLLGSTAFKLVADDVSNTLIVTARSTDHSRIQELLEQFDAAPQQFATPLRFYKLLNRRADDVFATLGALLGGSETQPPDNAASSAGNSSERSRTGGGGSLASSGLSSAGGSTFPPRRPDEDRGDRTGSENRAGSAAIHGEGFSISLDEHTNSIIVIAKPELHQQIEQLIQQLDKRRPQVLVEVTLVSVSVEDSLNLGVELNEIDLGEPWNYLLFTSFGMSTYNPTTGQRRLSVAPGGTGVLLGPDEAPLILQALQTRGNTRVYAAPRILVDDNATGRIESVSESPYTTVNASDTVATTAFGGFAKAGTQLSIEPHIAEGDHLEINYDLTVSSFTGSGSGTTPPPRSSDTISSTIRVPDGYTVVVGGLQTDTLGESTSQVPLIGDVPGLGWLFGTRSHSHSKVRLYAFIRPTILRDDGFEDLKYISKEDLKTAEVDDGTPPNRYQWMH